MSSDSVVVIGEVEVPVFAAEAGLLDDETYVREVTMLMSDVFKGDDLARSAGASLRAFRQYKALAAPTRPYPHFGAVYAPVFVYDYDKVIVLDTAAEKREIERITGGDGGFEPRTLISELRALGQFRGEIRRRVWRPLVSDRGETVPEPRDPVERHCETDKCAALTLADGKWGTTPVPWVGDSAETVRLLPGDAAYLRGLKGFPAREKGEGEIEYFRRVRPPAADVVARLAALAPAAVDEIGLAPAFRGFPYDSGFSEALRAETSKSASAITTWSESRVAPEGLAALETRSSPHDRAYFRQKPSSKLDCAKRLKAARSKMEAAERRESRSKPEPGYVRSFDSFASMQAALAAGLRDRDRDPTPRDLALLGETAEEVMKASPVKITRAVAEDVLRGGKVIQEGELVLLVDRAGRRDVFEKSRDPQGKLFWALKGTVAVAGVRACGQESGVGDTPELAWDLCDIDAERVRAKADFYRDAAGFLSGCDDATDESARDAIIFFRSDGNYTASATEAIRRRGFVYEVSGANIVTGIDDVILHPEYREGFTEIPRDGLEPASASRDDPSDPSDVARMVVTRAVDGMSAGAMFDTIGVNTRVLKNMVMFAVSSVADVSTGDDRERKARALRLITSALQYTVVYVTMARQIADVDRRGDDSRSRLFEIAIQRAKAVDFSEYFPDRAPLRAAMDKKLVPDSVRALYDDELASSALLRDMITRVPDAVFALTTGGRSIKNWVGFRPALSEKGSPAYNDLRKTIRDAMLPSNRSVAGFSKRGRCCAERVPPLPDAKVAGEKSLAKDLEARLRAITKTDIAIRDDFARDAELAVANSLRRFARTLAVMTGPSRDALGHNISAKHADIKSDSDAVARVSGPGSGKDMPADPVARLENTAAVLKVTRDLLVGFVVEDLGVAASDDSVVSARMERAREDLKNLQVAYVESLDAEAKEGYLAQRDIGIKLDEVREYDLMTAAERTLGRDAVDSVDDDHEFGDYALETVEDDGTL